MYLAFNTTMDCLQTYEPESLFLFFVFLELQMQLCSMGGSDEEQKPGFPSPVLLTLRSHLLLPCPRGMPP